MHLHFLTNFKLFLQTMALTANQRFKLSRFLRTSYTNCLKEIETGKIDERKFEFYLSHIYVELGDPMIVWRMFEKFNMGRLSNKLEIICYLTSVKNAKTCLSEIVRLQDILLTPTHSIKLFNDNENIVMEFKDKNFNSPNPHYRNDVAISLVLYILREYIGKDFDYARLKIPKSRPKLVDDEVKKYTQATVSYHDGPMQVSISKKHFAFKNMLYDQSTNEQWRDKLEPLLTAVKKQITVTSKVISLLEKSEKPASETLLTIAEKLAASSSSLRRHLVIEETSFKDIQNKFLDELAIIDLLTSDIKVDSLALKLGYSERSPFERAFKKKTGRSPSKYRELATGVLSGQKELTIGSITDSMPPLPESCLQLIDHSSQGTLTVPIAVNIIEQDPIFIARIMGLANKAIYGSAPKNLADAIGHKLGLETIINLAIVSAAKDSLKDEITGVDIDAHIDAFLIGPKAYLLLKKASKLSFNDCFDSINQTLTIGPLGFLLMCHKKLLDHQTFADIVEKADGLQSLFIEINEHFDYSIFGTSILLLSHWGIENSVIRNLSTLEQHISKGDELSESELFILFTFEVMFEYSTHKSVSDKLIIRAKKEFGIDKIQDVFDKLNEE